MDLEIEFRDGVSFRRQLEDALRVAIRSGRLPPGSVLPPSRDLAEQLSVSRGVVVDSYAQLATEGYLSARRGSGTRVAATAASGRPPVRRQLPSPNAYRYELRPGLADFHAFPRAAWKAALLRALRELPDIRLTYGDHRGVPELRNALAGYLARVRGVVVDPEHVVVCCAASQALIVLWHVLRKRGGAGSRSRTPAGAGSGTPPKRPGSRPFRSGWTPTAWSCPSSPRPMSTPW